MDYLLKKRCFLQFNVKYPKISKFILNSRFSTYSNQIKTISNEKQLSEKIF